MGLSFMGTLRATQIRHDCKSERKEGREESVEARKDEVGDVTKTREGGGGGWGLVK